MLAKLHSLGVWALDGFVVTVEVDTSGGLPQFAIVGLPDSAVKEATDRVRSALKNLGFSYPVSRITVNLAPADIRKTGPVYDLPVLLGLLASSGQIAPVAPDCAFIGELSLDGQVRPVTGVLPMAIACEKAGIKRLFVPRENAVEAAVVETLQVFALQNAKQAVDHLEGRAQIVPTPVTPIQLQPAHTLSDMADVRGQYEARRAVEIAAAGQHNILLIGAPGSGKSMLAKRLPGILPPLTRAEAVECNKIYSVAGLLQQNAGGVLLGNRPFRAPHHSVSPAGLSGGGAQPKPGEISLSHNGVLFLDELPEFQRDALEILRQPLEDGTVTVSRVAGSATYPCRFMLVAAMNPCPCGFYGHPTRPCRCVGQAMERYLHKVSGPLLDRIDLHVEVQPAEYEQLSGEKHGERSADILQRVMLAHEVQRARSAAFAHNFVPNAALQGEALRRACALTEAASSLLKNAFERLGLSARGYDKVLRISRTIADLDGEDTIGTTHVNEAVQYRNLDRKYWHTV